VDQNPLRVAVLVTLVWHPGAGGHVKVWERFVDAAATAPDIDLTVFFLGQTEQVVERGPNARLHLLPPRFGTDRFKALDSGAGHTDLAGHHPALTRRLAGYDLLVTTDHFSFAGSAERAASAHGIPLTHSMHTNVEALTRAYAPGIVRRLLGARVGGWLAEALHLGERLGRAERRKLHRHLGQCAHVFVSNPADGDDLRAAFPNLSQSLLRRGLDLEMFHPAKRDRAWLEDRFGVPPGRAVAVFAGRADASKRVLVAAEATRRLIDQGRDIILIVAGAGRDLARAQEICGDRLVAPGVLPQADLARLYASADLFVFPSESEVAVNVVPEALASGLPVVVSGRPGGCAHRVPNPDECAGIVTSDSVDAWAEAMAGLLAGDREAQRAAARRGMEGHAATWAQVFAEDLAAPWRRIAGR